MRFAAVLLIAVYLPGAARAAGPAPLVDAVERGDVAAVRALLDRRADLELARADGLTPLLAAVHADRLDLTDLLLRAGAKASGADRYGVTPLYLAALNGSAP